MPKSSRSLILVESFSKNLCPPHQISTCLQKALGLSGIGTAQKCHMLTFIGYFHISICIVQIHHLFLNFANCTFVGLDRQRKLFELSKD